VQAGDDERRTTGLPLVVNTLDDDKDDQTGNQQRHVTKMAKEAAFGFTWLAYSLPRGLGRGLGSTSTTTHVD
jgi:hypothetical protein